MNVSALSCWRCRCRLLLNLVNCNKQKEYLNMGQQSSSISEANRLYEMPLPQYILKERVNSALSVWKKKSPPCQQLIECRMVVNTEQQLKQIYDIFSMRHMHIYLPATRYLTCEQQGIKRCGGYYKGNIYVESAVTTLLMINDIPFLDSLHLYSIAFKGFEILFSKFGYFDIFEDMFHICENGKVKVWCNSQIYKLKPQPYLLDPTGKQEDMIYRVINLIDQNVDKGQPINFKRQLYKRLPNNTHFKSFQHCNIVFREICKERGWQPPERLRCISQLTKQDLQKLLLQQQSEQNIFKEHFPSQHVATANTLNQETMNKLLGDGKTSLRLSPRNQLYENIHTHRQYKPSIESLHIQKEAIIQDHQINLSRQKRFPVYQHNLPTSTIINQLSSPLRQNSQPFLTLRKYRQDNFIDKKIEPLLPNSNIRILSVQRRDKRSENKNNFFGPSIQPNFNQVQFSPNHNQAIHSPRINQKPNISFKIQSKPIQIPPFHSPPPLPPKIQINHLNLSPQSLSHNLNRNHQLEQRSFIPINRNKSQFTLQQIFGPRPNQKITFNNDTSLISQKKYMSTFQPEISSPTNKKKQSSQNENKISQNKGKDISNTKILKSVILPDNIELPKNSNNINNESIAQQLSQDRNTFPRTQQATSKIILSSRPSSALKRNFIQRFEQSLESQQIGNPFEAILKNNAEQKSESDNSRTQWQHPKINSEINDKKRIQYSETKSEYTDPKFFQMLSSKDISSITINPTFNFTLSHEAVANKQVISKATLTQQKLNENQLYFSFSKGTKDKYQTNQLTKRKDGYNNATLQLQQVVTSQDSSSTRRRYEAGIDKQIWSDLVQLRKNRHYY